MQRTHGHGSHCAGRVPAGCLVGMVSAVIVVLIFGGLLTAVISPLLQRARATAAESAERPKHSPFEDPPPAAKSDNPTPPPANGSPIQFGGPVTFITMEHGAGRINPEPTTINPLECRLRLPMGLNGPESMSISAGHRTFAKGSRGSLGVSVRMIPAIGNSFESHIEEVRRELLAAKDKTTMEDSEEARINGRRAWVFTTRANINGREGRGRIYCLEDAGGNFYDISGFSPAESWVTGQFDSMACTFEVGPWTDNTGGAAQAPGFTPTPSPAPPPAFSGGTPRRFHGFVEAQVDGKWETAMVLEEQADKAHVRLLRSRTDTWLPFDQIRQRAPSTPPAESVTGGAPPVRPTPPTGAGEAPVVHGAAKPPPAEPTVDSAIVMLSASSAIERAKGAEALAAMTPDKDRRAAVIAKLAEVWRENNIFTQPPAAKALALWADDATEKQFIDRLVTGKREERKGLFEMLANRTTPAAAKALAKRLRVPDDAATIDPYLKKMGVTAEPAVREMLTDIDKKVRQHAIEILHDIGTKDSLPALQKAAADADATVAASARLSIDAINTREK